MKFMRDVSSEWAEPFREMIQALPDDADVKTLKLEDWVPKQGMWDNKGGKATLVGDAAHAMTMCKFPSHSLTRNTSPIDL